MEIDNKSHDYNPGDKLFFDNTGNITDVEKAVVTDTRPVNRSGSNAPSKLSPF